MADSQPPEQPSVRTTIVGGRPPGSGQPCREAPRGIEILIKKAAVDRTFAALLLKDRDAAAATIGLTLAPSEATMLQNIPAAQLAAMVRQTEVRSDLQPIFKGAVAAVMLAALSAALPAHAEETPPRNEPAKEEPAPKETPANLPTSDAELKPKMVCKILPRKPVAIAVFGASIMQPGMNQPDREMVEFPPDSTPELDQLTPEEVQARVEELVQKLGDERFAVREQATLRLMQLGPRIQPLIAKINVDDAEVTNRLTRIRRAMEVARQAEGHLQLRNGQWEWNKPEEPAK